MYDVIILGGGPAGAAAGVYCARKKLKTLLITKEFGGQSIVSDDIENWIGETHISGLELAKKLEGHVRAYENKDIDIKIESVEAVDKIDCEDGSDRPCDFEVTTDKGKYQGKTVILTLGAKRRRLGVPGEDKFEGKGVVYCATCFPTGEEIIANSSISAIDKVEKKRRVLTHDGTFQEVLDVMERNYEGDLLEIKVRFFSESVKLTPNHPVLATTVEKGNAERYFDDFKINNPEWLRADQLTNDHVLLYPIISEIEDKDYLTISEIVDGVEVVNDKVKWEKESPTSKRIPNKIKITEDFMRLVGYFMAEGCITNRGVNLYFHKKEKKYVNDVSNLFSSLFGLSPNIHDKDNVTRIEVYSHAVRDLFEKTFGKYSYGKSLPHWVLLLPQNKLKEFVKGYYRGDGCKREKDFCFVSNSRNLIYQLRDVLLKLGVISSIQRRKKDDLNKNPGKIDGRKIEFKHDKYHLVVGGSFLEKMSEILDDYHRKIDERKRTYNHAWIKDNYAYLPIRSIKKLNYKGLVHNLTIDKNNTYVSKSFIVHNCDAPLFAGRDVAVVGGGNAGVEAAIDLLAYAEKIYLLQRSDKLKADPVSVDRVKNEEKIKIIYNANTTEVVGDVMVEGLIYKDENDEEQKLEVGGVFVEIGSVPNSNPVEGLVEIDNYGQIKIDSKHASTSQQGIFAAGDITDDPYKQNNISAGDAVKAALAAYAYLQKLNKKSPATE